MAANTWGVVSWSDGTVTLTDTTTGVVIALMVRSAGEDPTTNANTIVTALQAQGTPAP